MNLNINRLENLISNKKIAVYGIGNQSFECIKYLEQYNVELILFDGNEDKWGTYAGNRIIHMANEIVDICGNEIPFVIASIRNQNEIAKMLNHVYGIEIDRIFCYISKNYKEKVLDQNKIKENYDKVKKISEWFSD